MQPLYSDKKSKIESFNKDIAVYHNTNSGKIGTNYCIYFVQIVEINFKDIKLSIYRCIICEDLQAFENFWIS